MSREKELNCTNGAAVLEVTAVFRWFDEEPSLSVAILTSTSKKALSTGVNLKEWNDKVTSTNSKPRVSPSTGSGDVPSAVPMSNQLSKKPVIAAVKGIALKEAARRP